MFAQMIDKRPLLALAHMGASRPEPKPAEIHLTLKEPPSSNRWHRNVNGRTILSKAARDYTAYVGDQCVLARVKKIAAPTPVAVLIEWHRSRKSGDLDKRLGVLLDALQGSCYSSDSQIVRIVAERRDSERRGFVDVTVVEAVG
jgi:Holliday junction resolvase RusA-like endonuclease